MNAARDWIIIIVYAKTHLLHFLLRLLLKKCVAAQCGLLKRESCRYGSLPQTAVCHGSRGVMLRLFVLRRENKVRVGLDIGSTTIKCVVLGEHDELLYSTYERHYSHILE